MPFGYLLAKLSSQESALLAAKDDPNRKLPELVYTMFVPLSRRIPDVYAAQMVKYLVKAGRTRIRMSILHAKWSRHLSLLAALSLGPHCNSLAHASATLAELIERTRPPCR